MSIQLLHPATATLRVDGSVSWRGESFSFGHRSGGVSVKLDNIPHYLGGHRQDELVVEFDDGDKYPVAALDLTGKNPEGEFEITVWFKDCVGESTAEAQALAAGSLKHSPPGTWWSSGTPRQPVGMQYTTLRILTIYDNAAGYFVYERDQTG